MKKILIIALVSAILLAGGVVAAQGLTTNLATVVPSGQDVFVSDNATNNSPALEKAVFIHYAKGFARPDNPSNSKPPKNREDSCFGFLAKGAKLQNTEDLVINPDLNLSAIVDGASEWDSKTSTALFGNYTEDETADWDSSAPDGRNELSLGNYPSAGVIAVTVVWGNFSGPPSSRSIQEFDVMFDNDFVWGDAASNPSIMDLQNIATHEIGHGLGLDDIYQSDCSAVTMYGYSYYGEIIKRSLEQADITGLQTLYGN